MYDSPAGPLCLDCYKKVQEIAATAYVIKQHELNVLKKEFNDVAGIEIASIVPVPDALSRKTVMNVVKIDRSIIGAVNTGKIEHLEVAMGDMVKGGSKQLADVVKMFTEAALKEKALDQKAKSELLDQIRFLLEEAKTAKKDQKPGAIKSVMSGIEKAVAVSASLLKVWQEAYAAFGPYFS
jgi:uncharacterized protein YfbU (UPF0304 family)